MQITLQTLNKYFNINRNKAQDNQKNYQVQNFGIANPFAPISRDVVEISFGASRCSTQNFQIKNKIENLRCPACGLIMLTEKQISNFATEVGACRGEELIEALEKYEDESTLTGKPSQDKTGFGVYRPLKKEIVDVYKELARENPELNLLELTQLEATNCIQELIDKQMDVIWELEDYIKTNFDEETQKEFLDKIEGFVSQIQGETEETFARKKFIYAIDSLVQDADAKAKLKEITSKMPTSENDIDSFFVKYSHKTAMPANSSESCSHCISLSHTFNYSVVNLPAPLIRSHIKTRTLLQPFVRLYPTVAVGVGTQVTVTAHTGDAEILLQAADEGTHREFLLLCAGIRRMSVLVQTTLVGDADALAVEPQGVGTYLLQRTSAPDVAVLTDVEVIADALHPLARWQRSKSFCVKSTSTRVAVQCTTISVTTRFMPHRP